MKFNLLLSSLFIFLCSLPTLAQETPELEVFTGYSLLNRNPASFYQPGETTHGWIAAANYNFNRWVGAELNVNGGYNASRVFGFNSISRVRANTHSISIGPRFTYRSGKAITPFAHALVGVSLNRFKNEEEFILRSSNSGGVPVFGLQSLSSSYTYNSTEFTSIFGGGFDLKITERIHWRAVQADYLLMRNGGDTRSFFRYSTGPVFRIGRKD